MTRKALRIVGAIFCAVMAACATSCNGSEDGGEIQGETPQVTSTDPEDGAKDLTGTSLTVTFNFDQNVKCPSSGQSGITCGDATIDKVSAPGSYVAVTVSGLEEGRTYTLIIPYGTISGYRNNPVGELTLTFTMKEYVDYDINPDTSLSNANASPAASALYASLLDRYGSYTISGTMGGITWENTVADYIYEQTGKYPGIIGYDYIHATLPDINWAPDYDDISDIQKAYSNGNVIQIGWHWMVPSSSSAKGDWTCYSYNTAGFGVTKALADGTWQNEIMTEHLDIIAAHLKVLCDAGIPVLFRPLHEAAGDYSWGAWFWWGYDGADACVRLWRHVYDYFTGTWGLDNLIWVWTAQTSYAGNLADVEYLEEWYPGDSYVDIVGADLYVDQWTTQSDAFRLVNNSVQGRKMVVLSEMGNLFDIDACFDEGAPWGYFMNWYGLDDDGNYALYSGDTWKNSVSDWKSVLTNSHVLNRGEIF